MHGNVWLDGYHRLNRVEWRMFVSLQPSTVNRKQIMRRTILLSAMSLLLSATEAAAACAGLDGFWKFSSLIVEGGTARATDCTILISGNTIQSIHEPCIDAGFPDYLIGAVFGGLGTSCSFQFGDRLNCFYRGELNGAIAAGSVYCSTGGVGTFDLILFTP